MIPGILFPSSSMLILDVFFKNDSELYNQTVCSVSLPTLAIFLALLFGTVGALKYKDKFKGNIQYIAWGLTLLLGIMCAESLERLMHSCHLAGFVTPSSVEEFFSLLK